MFYFFISIRSDQNNSRNGFRISEMKMFELVKEWHTYHNRTSTPYMELIEMIRL